MIVHSTVMLYTVPMNINRYFPFLINMLVTINPKWWFTQLMLLDAKLVQLVGHTINRENIPTAFGSGVSLSQGCLMWTLGKPSIHVMWQTLPKPRGLSLQALTFFGGARFIARCLRHLFLWKCWQSLKHFWSHRLYLGNGLAPGPTLKKTLCRTHLFGRACNK